ncbi:hypothetical protein [Oleiphilus messinensis]|uniref:hypothetical protein n=1 Tax=Oleiphilus messinensis TaxID=141451 RepID=UPI0012F70C21|nr:hypothetical protein [Oleiphilus messinensis]
MRHQTHPLRQVVAVPGSGSTDEQMSHLPDAIREKVHNQTCYSEEVHGGCGEHPANYGIGYRRFR